MPVASTMSTDAIWLGIAIAAALVAAANWFTAGKLHWPRGPRLRTAAIGAALVLFLGLAPIFGAGVVSAADRASPTLAAAIDTAIVQPHSASVKRGFLVACAIPLVLSLVGLVARWRRESRVWWLASAAVFAGLFLGYIGFKVAAKDSGPALLALAVGGYLLSLSANFLAGALAPGSDVAKATIAALGPKLDEIKTDTEAIRATQSEHDKKLDLILKNIEDLKRPGVDPTQQPIPPDVLAAAKSLATSKDARERALAAIARRDWDAADQELAALRASPALDEAYQLHTLEGDRFYAEGKFDEAIAPYEAAFNLRPQMLQARHNLAIALTRARRGDRSAQLHRAIELYTGTLNLPELSKFEWAGTQNNLGVAWRNLPTGDRGSNLAKAIKAYEQALTVLTKAAAPMEWAGTQNNLGNAWLFMPTGDRGSNLAKAIKAYEQALTVLTKAAAPMDWATTQNNLGNAWAQLPTGDRGSNLAKAIEAYEAALTVRTKAAAPMEWAMTQNNLGNAWLFMPTGDRGSNLAKAIEAYERALTVYTKAAAPMEWATTQNNLGNAWAQLPTGDRGSNLAKAIEAFEQALAVSTKAAAPMDWAMTQNNLGEAWRNLPTGDRGSNLAKAVEASEQALTVLTKAAAPMDWATTQNNLGIALADLAEFPGQDLCALLRRSIAASKGALTVSTPEAFPQEHAQTKRNLAITRRRYESLPCSQPPGGVPFDTIPPAE